MKAKGVVFALVASAVCAGAMAVAPPAKAAGPIDLGLTTFGRIVVDPATSHIFVSSPLDNEIVVLDLSGNTVKTITGETGAEAMVVVGSTLYVTLTTAGAIDRIDTGTLKETSTLVTGLTSPADLAYAAGKLWLFTGQCAVSAEHLGSVDPNASSPALTTYSSVGGYCPRFARNHASNPSFLLTFERGLSPTTVSVIDVSGSTPVVTQSVLELAISNTGDAAINPDGTHFVIASGAPYAVLEYNLSDLTQDGIVYQESPYPTAVDTTAAHGGVVVGGINGIYDPDLYAYQIGNPSQLMQKVDFGGTSNTVGEYGVAISPDGFTAYALTRGTGSQVLLNVVAIPTPPPPTVPDPPINVTATAGHGNATVQWSRPPSDGRSPLTGYTVTATPGGLTVGTAPSVTTAVMSPLTNGTAYTFTVTATNAYGTSAPSAPSAAVTPGVPSAPLNVVAVAGVGSASLTWLAPTDTGATPLTGYTITSSGGATLVVGPSAVSATIAGLSSVPHTFTVTATNSIGDGPPSAPTVSVTPAAGGTYNALTPARILDTRTGNGGFPIHRVSAGSTISLQVLGRGGAPSTGVSAVVLNLTVTDTTGPGYVVVYPTGASRPLASNINYTAGQTVANLDEVAVGFAGRVDLYVSGASADLVVDVEGWVGDATDSYTRLGLFVPMPPARILDTRTGNGSVKAKLGPGESRSIQVTGRGGVYSSGVSAVVLNVTVTGPTQASYLTVYPTGASLPQASNLNFVAGQTVANRVMVAVGSSGQITIHNSTGTVDVIADVSGQFTDAHNPGGGAPYVATIPSRLFDTRTCACKLGPGYVLDLQLTAGPATSALVLNVTATDSTAYGYLTVYPDDGTLGQGPPPLASDLNLRPNVTLANMCVVMMIGDGAFNIYNAAGSTDVVVDAEGYYGGWVLAPPDGLLHPLIASESTGSPRLPSLSVRVPARLRVPSAG